jgi:hypothetical protein
MKIQSVLIGFLAASISGQVLAQDDAPADELNDQLAYATSIIAPALTELCTPLVPTYPTKLDASFHEWLSRNRESIDRGKQMEISHLWPGKTIGDFEQLTIEATRDSFNAGTDDQRRERCNGTLMLLSSDAGAVGV